MGEFERGGGARGMPVAVGDETEGGDGDGDSDEGGGFEIFEAALVTCHTCGVFVADGEEVVQAGEFGGAVVADALVGRERFVAERAAGRGRGHRGWGFNERRAGGDGDRRGRRCGNGGWGGCRHGDGGWSGNSGGREDWAGGLNGDEGGVEGGDGELEAGGGRDHWRGGEFLFGEAVFAELADRVAAFAEVAALGVFDAALAGNIAQADAAEVDRLRLAFAFMDRFGHASIFCETAIGGASGNLP